MSSTWWKKADDLNEDQKKVVGLGKEGDYLVLGPAGCGKTNLLLLRATFLHKAKVSNIVVLTFGRVLREFLATGSAHYPFSNDKVLTCVRWGAELLKANGVSFDDKSDFESVRKELFEKLEALAAVGNPSNRFDCILIDEAQDYSEQELTIIRAFAHQIFAVGDNNQRLTNAAGGLAYLESIVDETITLHDHYRNGLKICRLADGIRDLIDHEEGMEASSKYDETSYVSSARAVAGMTIAEQAAAAAEEIQHQLLAYPDELIGILCPRREDLKAARAALASSPIADDIQSQEFGEYATFRSDKRVILASIHSAKGLEFRALHILAAEGVKKFPTQKNMSYTAATRAKTSLRIYHLHDLPGYLEKGLAAVDDAPQTDPSVADLFL